MKKGVPRRSLRAWAFGALFVLGLMIWAAGSSGTLEASSVVSGLAILCGGTLTVLSAFFFFYFRKTDGWERENPYDQQEMASFCVGIGMGLGVANIGIAAIFGATASLFLVVVGGAMVICSPLALHPNRYWIQRQFQKSED
jgi:hypothetical protein